MQESDAAKDKNTFQPNVALFLDVPFSLPSTLHVRLEAWDAELQEASFLGGADYIQWYATTFQGFSTSSSLTVDTRQGTISTVLYVCKDCYRANNVVCLM